MLNDGRDVLQQLVQTINKNNQRKIERSISKIKSNEDYIYTKTVFCNNIFILAKLYSFLYKD